MSSKVVVQVTCDLCGEEFIAEPNVCYSLQIGDRVYDICTNCRDTVLLDRLAGKGTAVVPHVCPAPIVIPIVPQPFVPVYPPLDPNIWPNTGTPFPNGPWIIGDPPPNLRPTITYGTSTIRYESTCCRMQ